MFDAEVVAELSRFVSQRQLAWYNKTQLKPRPWCEDPIVNEYLFTNVFRLLDPGTQFVVDKILSATDYSVSDRLFNVLLYRVIGRESTYAYILEKCGLIEQSDITTAVRYCLESALQSIKESGEPPFSRAYTVPGYDWAPGPDKVAKFCWQAQQWSNKWELIFDRCSVAHSPEIFYDTLRELQGVGNFIASQVYVDCTYLCHDGKTLFNWDPSFYRKWMKAGPGALDGLSRLTGKKMSVAEVQKRDLAMLLEVREMIVDVLCSVECVDTWPTVSHGYPNAFHDNPRALLDLSIMDAQNCCCELSKYDKLTRREGNKSRRKYTPRLYSSSEWTDNEFVARVARDPVIGLDFVLRNSDGAYVSASLGGEDVTRFVAKFSGYPLEVMQDGQVTVFLPNLDEVKYPPKDGNSDPVTEINYHFNCGLQITSDVRLKAI